MNLETLKIIETLKRVIPIFNINKVEPNFAETLGIFIKDGNFELDRERVNILLSYFNLPPMEVEFYNYYIEKNSIKKYLTSIDDIEKVFIDFIKDALWHFGDLFNAYLVLSKTKDLPQFFKAHHFDETEFHNRLAWNLILDIPPQDRGFLGYVSGDRPKKEILDLAVDVINEVEKNKEKLEGKTSEEISEIVLKNLSTKHPEIKEKVDELRRLNNNGINLFNAVDVEKTKRNLDIFRKQIEETVEKIEKLKHIGKINQEHYLRNIESIDVYVATSMRNDEEYNEMSKFVEQTFTNSEITPLNLRYFDPTLCYCDSRIDKGIIECLLVRSSKVTIYCAQEGDTFGKDSELAATLAQGKPVIVYVPTPHLTDDKFVSIEDELLRTAMFYEASEKADKRAKVFKDFHPLGLQVGLYDGVARGVIVVRTPEECALILKQVLTNSLKVDIEYEGNEKNGIILRERKTKSVIRVTTGWTVLANCFWNQFNKTKSPKGGRPE